MLPRSSKSKPKRLSLSLWMIRKLKRFLKNILLWMIYSNLDILPSSSETYNRQTPVRAESNLCFIEHSIITLVLFLRDIVYCWRENQKNLQSISFHLKTRSPTASTWTWPTLNQETCWMHRCLDFNKCTSGVFRTMLK